MDVNQKAFCERVWRSRCALNRVKRSENNILLLLRANIHFKILSLNSLLVYIKRNAGSNFIWQPFFRRKKPLSIEVQRRLIGLKVRCSALRCYFHKRAVKQTVAVEENSFFKHTFRLPDSWKASPAYWVFGFRFLVFDFRFSGSIESSPQLSGHVFRCLAFGTDLLSHLEAFMSRTPSAHLARTVTLRLASSDRYQMGTVWSRRKISICVCFITFLIIAPAGPARRVHFGRAGVDWHCRFARLWPLRSALRRRCEAS